MTNGAVRAIATNHPLDIERFLAPVGAPEEGCHRVFIGDEPRQFDLSLHLHSERIQMFFHQPLGVALRQHQRVRVRGVEVAEIDVSEPHLAGDDIGSRRLEARIDESRPAAHAVDQLEGATQITMAFDLSVRAAALSTIRTPTP